MKTRFVSFWRRRQAKTDRLLERKLRRERPRPDRSFAESARVALFASAAPAEDRRRLRLRGWSLITVGLLLMIVALVIAAS
jgi:hypothetical protein